MLNAFYFCINKKIDDELNLKQAAKMTVEKFKPKRKSIKRKEANNALFLSL
jgi:hypothetical protein